MLVPAYLCPAVPGMTTEREVQFRTAFSHRAAGAAVSGRAVARDETHGLGVKKNGSTAHEKKLLEKSFLSWDI